MAENEKKGITVKVDAELHAEVREFLERNGITMAEFVSKALENELHPKFVKEEKTMGNMRTMAFQVPEELFQKIKDYLTRNNMTQKEFVIGLIEAEIERDLAQRAAEGEDVSEKSEDEDEEQEEDEGLDEDIDEDTEETESVGMSMNM